jgi:hypothetical protein
MASPNHRIGPDFDLPVLVSPNDRRHATSADSISECLYQELDVSRLDKMVERGLWLAGRVGNLRPFHRQKMLQRSLVVTEQMDLHLLWYRQVIFIKPLPLWLLDSDFVTQYLSKDVELTRTANGFLSTYARLIVHTSDFRIAQEAHLLPESLDWAHWQRLAPKFASLLSDIATGKIDCLPRFYFGELRLGRINMIYRYHPAYRLKHFLRGYYEQSQTYQSFLRRNFAWLIAVFAYSGIVLTAMQVGLGTVQLQANQAFNNASYGFTIFAILLPLLALVAALITSLCLTIYNIRLTRQHMRQNLPPSRARPASKV